MKVLAIDPGYERLGIAVLEKDPDNGKEYWIHSETFRTMGSKEFVDRLNEIGKRLEYLIEIHKPEMLAIENLFLSNNQKTAMRVAEVRGAILYIARSSELEVYEYTPLQIKVAVGGHGKADKHAVIDMTQKLVQIPKAPAGSKRLDDEYDAIACGLAHFAYYRRPQQ